MRIGHATGDVDVTNVLRSHSQAPNANRRLDSRQTEDQPMPRTESSRGFNTMRWTLFTAAGLACGLTAGVLAGIPLGRDLNAMIVTALVTCIIGGVLGVFQVAGSRRVIAKSSPAVPGLQSPFVWLHF
jgi:F0F1-type ATP synthase assembly protein I